eukprot:comp19494_c0_seq1/m.22747 comp19494_c0_seq1/g.22747  ORF comp19494_c0_seq1/g.22747 comp19494_c0_seq1/m.22747 type:complete len:145 (-) comp19494_c0_seq1:653-1087(-)
MKRNEKRRERRGFVSGNSVENKESEGVRVDSRGGERTRKEAERKEGKDAGNVNGKCADGTVVKNREMGTRNEPARVEERNGGDDKTQRGEARNEERIHGAERDRRDKRDRQREVGREKEQRERKSLQERRGEQRGDLQRERRRK